MSVKKALLRIANIPFVWDTLQDIVGANAWKNSLYPSVFKSKGTLLDFGCSSGNNTEAFLDFEYYGIDLDETAISGAQEKWKGYPHIHFYSLDILKAEFKEDFFDHILFACTGHHLTDEQIKKILPILISALKPTGVLHFFDVVRQPGKDRFITRLVMNNDQGKYMRTIEEYEKIFSPYEAQFREVKLFPSPDRFIKLQDMLYVELTK